MNRVDETSSLEIRTAGDTIVTTIRMESGETAFFAAGEFAIARMMLDYREALTQIRGLPTLKTVDLDILGEPTAG